MKNIQILSTALHHVNPLHLIPLKDDSYDEFSKVYLFNVDQISAATLAAYLTRTFNVEHYLPNLIDDCGKVLELYINNVTEKCELQLDLLN
jgi:hypothetical protein